MPLFALSRSARIVAAAALLALALRTASAQAVAKAEHRITESEIRELFGMVDELAKFASESSGLPLRAPVQRAVISRAEVERFVREKFDEDESAKRMARSEAVLKKFGLLERSFELKPFLLELLKEQLEGYYDAKKKKIFLLDWLSVEAQRPVMAHELTHALQDQKVDIVKWSGEPPQRVSASAPEDAAYILRDEQDIGQSAVLEGQATAVMLNYALRPTGMNLVQNPRAVEWMRAQMGDASNSPVLARSPRLLTESMLFPYREGLSFVQQLWIDHGREAAFSGALARPPRSSWETLNPRAYEAGARPPVPVLPDIHPLLDKLYQPYDLGQIGLLDLRILAGDYGGEEAVRRFAPAWDGGLYWAGRRRDGSPATAPAETRSLALFYLSVWKDPRSAQQFATLYGDALGRAFESVARDAQAELNAESLARPERGVYEEIYQTNEGPALISVQGRMVFVAESFDLALARQLAQRLFAAQGGGELRAAQSAAPELESPAANLVRFFSTCGTIKLVSEAAQRAAREAGAAPQN